RPCRFPSVLLQPLGHLSVQVESTVYRLIGLRAALSDRKTGIAFDDVLAEHGPLTRLPERCRVDDAVAERTAIGTIAARDRSRNADELGPHVIAGEPHRRIAV